MLSFLMQSGDIYNMPEHFAEQYSGNFSYFLDASSRFPSYKLWIATIVFVVFFYQAQHQRGTANGISVTAMSFFKAIAPAVGGIV